MCTWQAITNVLDHYYPGFFVLTVVAFFAVALLSVRAESAIKKRRPTESRKRSWWWKLFVEEEKAPTAAEFRVVGYAWLVPIRRVVIAGVIVLVAYAATSPTFCLNLKCEGRVNWLEPDPTCPPAIRSTLPEGVILLPPGSR